MNAPRINPRPILTAVVLIGALAAAPALAEDPYLQPDDSWISISGTVESVTRDAFLLDYGDGAITVEMDDGDRDADAYKLLVGDKVTVYGVVDNDLFETTTIEASRVYVEKLGTYFYASAVDEEDTWFYSVSPIIVSDVVLQGVVTDVNDEELVGSLDVASHLPAAFDEDALTFLRRVGELTGPMASQGRREA